VCEETFAPILYVMSIDEPGRSHEGLHNDVPQGLSSADLHRLLRTAERSWPPPGRTAASPTSTSAPRARKSAARSAARRTGGGRESGSDAWKAYMRRQTNTINWSRELPLAQGPRVCMGNSAATCAPMTPNEARTLYSTDASLYQVMPHACVIPIVTPTTCRRPSSWRHRRQPL
jgi:hypothetical protein